MYEVRLQVIEFGTSVCGGRHCSGSRSCLSVISVISVFAVTIGFEVLPLMHIDVFVAGDCNGR